MTLIVEDGTGKSDAESLASVAFADSYNASIGNTAWAALDNEAKEIALRIGTSDLSKSFRSKYAGYRTYSTQALDFPRTGIYLANGSGAPILVGSNVIPLDIQRAVCDMASLSSQGKLGPQTKRGKSAVKVGPISVTYDSPVNPADQYAGIRGYVATYLSASASGVGYTKVIRS